MSDLSGVLDLLCEIDDPKQMEKVLGELLTPSEVKDLSLRWALMEQLFNSVPQREIAAKLGISLCKITRGAKIIKNENSEILKWFKKNK